MTLTFLEVGDLDVYIRSESDEGPALDESVFHREGNQGADWIRGDVLIPRRPTVYKVSSHTPFQGEDHGSHLVSRHPFTRMGVGFFPPFLF